MRRLATLAALLLAAVVPAARAVDLPDRLAGTWHVLVHYKDASATHPDEERWDDRVWVFEKTGDRLRWTEYPIAVFSDESGRFERRSTGQLARVLGYWEPSELQLAEIKAGLELNSRGMKSKTLRFSKGVWGSASRSTAASASVVSYTESWSIEGTPELPIFRREDSLGGERTDTLDGVTLYTTASVDPTGDVLEGGFERDGSRRGKFRLLRAGAGKALTTKRTQAQRTQDAFLEQMSMRKLDESQLTAQDRADVRMVIRSELEKRMRKLKLDPVQNEAKLNALVPSIESRLYSEHGTLRDIPKLVEEAVVAP
ncbi:MAG TPA: hypothetical protein VII72_13010 [Myxococcota bacterium]|jgi:hypothetical protein